MADTQSIFEGATNEPITSQRPFVDEINTDDEPTFDHGFMKPFCDDSSDDDHLFKQNSDLILGNNTIQKPVCPPLIFKQNIQLKQIRTTSEGKSRPSTSKSRDCMLAFNPFKVLIQGKGSKSNYKTRSSKPIKSIEHCTIEHRTIDSKHASRKV